MKYVLPAAVVLLPLVAFLIAGVIELQSGRRPVEKALSLVPVLLGILVYGVSWGPVFLPHFPELRFGNWLTFSSAVVACSGAVIPLFKTVEFDPCGARRTRTRVYLDIFAKAIA